MMLPKSSLKQRIYGTMQHLVKELLHAPRQPTKYPHIPGRA